MKIVNPYFNFPGKTEEAFNFYKSVFGGEFLFLQRFKDTPQAGPISPDEANGIMHVSLKVGESTLMGTDAVESAGHKVTMGNNVNLSLETDSREEADRIFKGLSPGASNIMPLQDMFWGSYWGSLKDKYGVCWMVNYTKPKQ
ncbi:MAG: VOC family protein [Bacteroidota bacterium]|nr:VOC family protein [Bacteroidota bacterium]